MNSLSASGTLSALVHSAMPIASRAAVTDQVNQILAGFGAFFSAPPTVDIGEVVAYIDNS